MNIVHFHPGSDTAGQSMAGKAVLEAGGDSVRVFVKRQHPFGYSQAELWDLDAMKAAYAWADVVVIHNEPSLFYRVTDGSAKRLVVHHHGTRFRSNPTIVSREAEEIGAHQVVSTIDLLLSMPDGVSAQWFPQLVDVDRLAAVRAAIYRPDGRIRIGHAPTNRLVKGTRHVIRASRRMKEEADFAIIQRQPWAVCIALKATCDIFIDQLNLGYGNNAIEAWALGLPVLAGAMSDVLARMRQEFGGSLPFLKVTSGDLLETLRMLVREPDQRAAWAERGQQHVERYHAPQSWAERARSIYGPAATVIHQGAA